MKLKIRLDEFLVLMKSAAKMVKKTYQRPILTTCSIRMNDGCFYLDATDSARLININITQLVTVIESMEKSINEIHFDPLMAIRAINMIEADDVMMAQHYCIIERGDAEKEILLTIMREGSKKKLVVTSLDVVDGDFPKVSGIYEFTQLDGPLSFDICMKAEALEAVVKLAKQNGNDSIIRFVQADGRGEMKPFIIQIREGKSDHIFSKANIVMCPVRNYLRHEAQPVKCFTSTVQPVVQA